MKYLRINGYDVSHLVKGMKIGYEQLVAENGGRNANGDAVIEWLNEKIKLYITFRPMDGYEMTNLLECIKSFKCNVEFKDSRTNTDKVISCYTGTPEPEYYWIHDNDVLYKQMELNFIEL